MQASPTVVRSRLTAVLRRVFRSFGADDVFISYAREQTPYADPQPLGGRPLFFVKDGTCG